MNNFSTIAEAIQNPNSSGILTFFLGFLAMILINNIILYFQHRKRIYIYYIVYISLIFLNSLSFISGGFFDLLLGSFKETLLNYDAFFRWFYQSFYFLFAFRFLDLQKHSKLWDKIIRYPIYTLLLIAILLQSTTIITGDWGYIMKPFEQFFIPIITILGVIGYYFLFKIKSKFKNYIIIGSLFLFITSLTSAALFFLELLPEENHLRDTISYFGFTVENILFVLALSHQQKYELEQKNMLILEGKKQGLKAVIEAQEKEQRRIAKDLHDGVLQQIGGVILQSRNFMEQQGLAEYKESIDLMQKLEESSDELRNISHRMMPKALSELGIVAAIDDMLDNSLKYTNITYSFEHFNIKNRLPENIEITIYRVLQELINNIVKHSQAQKVNIQLFKNKKAVILIAEDDGIGIVDNSKKEGVGLLNINSRIDMIGGTSNFESKLNEGTLFTAKIPLENE